MHMVAPLIPFRFRMDRTLPATRPPQLEKFWLFRPYIDEFHQSTVHPYVMLGS